MTTMALHARTAAPISAPHYADDATRWQAVVNKDARADGAFFYSVKTTGVYCRPSCAARPARRENVAFHTTCADAERAGFRACKRCKPDQGSLAERRALAIEKACRLIEDAEELPDLAAMAEAAGMSRHHFHRVFKSITGVTPKAYAAAHRARKVRGELARAGSITEAIYDAGFNSNGRFYAKSSELLGMTPTDFRTGGTGAEIRFAVCESSLGPMMVAATDKGVCTIAFDDNPDKLVRDLQDQFPKARLIGADASFEKMVAQVVGFIEAPALGLDLPLDVRGTAFQQRVWQALRRVPAGKTVSYADIARKIGRPEAVRAVAGACAANTIAVAIPCHRVVRTDGEISGYRWGVERKKKLLAKEAAAREAKA
ncbi:MAG TPA: bifunctional DNA-binding transcriptional regulator/O6-methylguanine-DNA methyltransferase Ada [Magnetospirillaceae bacterium]|jgi:AraC family transcriptional regulator of adaptative response/methylated-DNA-[protein]-cysteine methyltransferase